MISIGFVLYAFHCNEQVGVERALMKNSKTSLEFFRKVPFVRPDEVDAVKFTIAKSGTPQGRPSPRTYHRMLHMFVVIVIARIDSQRYFSVAR